MQDSITLTQDETPPVRSEDDVKEKRIAVVEIFGPTFQGEGPLAGSKTMFIRFGGCDYRCQKCDSLHAVIPSAVKANARYLTAEEIIDELCRLRGSSGTVWVTLSGGNPCMWDLTRLMQYLHGNGFAVAVETQGTIWRDWLLGAHMVVISPKSPGMGEKFEPEKFSNFVAQLTMNGKPFAVKVVVFSAQDIEFAVDVWQAIEPNVPPEQAGMMFLSLGNPFPPVLDDTQHLTDNPQLVEASIISHKPISDEHKLALLDCYRVLTEEVCQDPRITHMRFLPQLHVLAYSNESER
jgi:7-carboxy-7-deazaguanine synthase